MHIGTAVLGAWFAIATTNAVAQSPAEPPPQPDQGLAATTARNPEEDEAVTLDSVIVTGTHLRRIDIEGPLPVSVVTDVDLQRRGELTLSDALQDLPYNSFGIVGGDPLEDANASLPNLRGLGSKYTLTLLDGRRLPGHPSFNGAAAASINGLPQSAIARVEVLRDGASAIYGSDAIGGVINLITRTGKQQPQVGVQWEWPTGSGGDAWSAHFVDGGESARGQWLLTFEATHRDALRGGDRRYLLDNAPLSTQGNPGSFWRIGTPSDFQPDPRCPAAVDTSTTYPDSESLWGVFCGYRYRTLNFERDQLDNHSLFASGRYNFSDALSGFARVLVVRADTLVKGAPAPVFAAFVAADNPINPTVGELGPELGYDLELRYRLTQLGPRWNDVEEASWHALTGIEGRAPWFHGSDWSMDVYLNRYDRDKVGRHGYALLSPLNAAIAEGRFNPFTALPDDPTGLEAAGYKPRWRSESRAYGIHADTRFETLTLPGGRVGWAFGAEARHDQYSVTDDPAAVAGQLVGEEGAFARAERDYAAIYAEVLLPLGNGWQADAALRHDRYQSAGAATSPKLAIAWRPHSEWLLRASWGRGFQAPDLESAYAGPELSGDFFVDERACAIQPDDSCGPSVWNTVLVSNPDLSPERTVQQNAGLMWQPHRTLEFTLDYYRIRIDDQIMFLTGMQVAQNDLRCFQELRDCDRLREGFIERDASGNIVLVTIPKVNIAEFRTEGLDFEARWRPETRFGDFDISLRASRTLAAELQPFTDSPRVDQLGVLGHPRWRATANLDWRRGRHSWGASADYIDGQHACFEYVPQDPDCALRVASYTELGAYWTWETPWRAQFTLGARNLANREVPLAPKATFARGLFSYGLYDPIGRVLFLRYEQTF